MRLRYVVLRHEGIPDPHFDLMIEAEPGGELMTWRLPVWPAQGADDAVAIANHRHAYLDYEGEISGGRGRVTRLAAGFCRLQPISRDHCHVHAEQGWTLRLPLK